MPPEKYWLVESESAATLLAPITTLPGESETTLVSTIYRVWEGYHGDPARPDNIIFDITPNPYGGTGISAGGFGHPTCLNTSGSNTLPPVQP